MKPQTLTELRNEVRAIYVREMAVLYEAGASVWELARYYQLSYSTINKYIVSSGVQRRSAQDALKLAHQRRREGKLLA